MPIFLEVWFWKIAKRLIRKWYGADCKTRDIDDLYDFLKERNNSHARCPSCRAKEIIEWIDEHIFSLKSGF